MTAVVVVSTGEQIRAELALAAASLRESFQHYLTAGELLTEEKTRLPHGAWLPWLAENVGIQEREAQRYMRLAEHREALEQANPSGLTDLSIERALKQIAKPKPKPDVAAALRGFGRDHDEQPAPDDPDERARRLDAARERLQTEPIELTASEWRQLRRIADHAAQANEDIRAVAEDGLSSFAAAELWRHAEGQFRHAAALVGDLAFGRET
jgi:DUF3102 family protein